MVKYKSINRAGVHKIVESWQ